MKDSATAFRNEPRLAKPADFFVELRKGSFTDVADANRLVNVTLQRNRERVDRVVKGESSKEEIDAVFDAPTGKEAFVSDGRTDPRIRETYGVRVVIVSYRRIARGFRVHTAFPRNFDPAPASSKYRMDIYKSTAVEVTYDWRTDEIYAQATRFLNDMVGGPTSPDLKYPDKPRFYYFETEQEDEALREFIHKLTRAPR